MDRKRIIFLILFLAASALIAYALYRVFFSATPIGRPATPSGQGQTQTSSTFPTAGTGQGTVRPGQGQTSGNLPTSQNIPSRGTQDEEKKRTVNISTQPARSITADNKGVKFYNNRDGKFYRVNKDGQVEALSDEVFYSVDKVTWSPNRDESILEYPDGSNIYYDFETKKKVTLPRHWQEFAFSPNGDKIEAESIGYSPENRWLVVSNPDGTNVRAIEPLGENASKVTTKWSPNNQIIALSQTGEPMGGDRMQILPIGMNGERFQGLIVEGRGLEFSWSPQGKKLLYSVYNSNGYFKPELWIDNAEPGSIGTARRSLNINTWASKCAFTTERYVYCGVPVDLPTGAGFAPQIADTIQDELYKIDLQTGTRSYVPLDGQYTIKDIFVDEASGNLFFTDKTREGIFKVSI